eukprot:TRINITY_DN93971_c0_g1_i1.p1 TRINITY_DN93971_c0_g1~~TRINITY_DN93971_c0_g1_i1.p1  ORF type:complete len:292 (-),score=50.18 TRINITY_DN93971_c0_g1_i1:80-916(-)
MPAVADTVVSGVSPAAETSSSLAALQIWRRACLRCRSWPRLAQCFVALALVVCFRYVHKLLRHRCQSLPSHRNAQRQATIADPTFGGVLGLEYSRSRIEESWEDFLDALEFPKDSPIRGHVRKLFNRADLDEQLRGLFKALAAGAQSLSKGSFERFSRGIHGQVHVMLAKNTRVPLVAPTTEDVEWLAHSFDEVFPVDRPLDCETFSGVAKLVLLRRVVRTLMKSVGMEQLQEGTTAPIVVDVAVDLGGGLPPFRIHTVAPSSAPTLSSGERLDLIDE